MPSCFSLSGIGTLSMPRTEAKVSMLDTASLISVPGLTTPGQRIMRGTRIESSNMLGRGGPVTPPAIQWAFPFVCV